MSHHRTAIRHELRAALLAHPRFESMTFPKVWPGTIDASSLPVLGVLTPQDASAMASFTTTERRTLVQVALRRAGADSVEDMLDQDSDLIEAIVLAALRVQDRSCFLRDTSLVSNTDGAGNIGTLVMGFEVKTMRPEAMLPPAP